MFQCFTPLDEFLIRNVSRTAVFFVCGQSFLLTSSNNSYLNCLISSIDQDVADEQGNQKLVHCPGEIASLLCSQPSSSINLIHNNYIGHFQQFDDIVKASDYLSTSDVVLNEWRSDQTNDIGLNIAVRGVMISNEKPVTGRWMPIRSAKKDNNKK